MPSQGTQDLEARFAVFLNPIRDLTKNWEVDIAKYLEDYLVELSEIQITFDGGVTVMNFAEAAMLIQGSATVYSKKVEFLWQMVLQMLDLLSSKRSLEKVAEGEAGSGGRGPRQPSACATLEFESADPLPVGKSINMKDEEDEGERRNEFKFLPGTPLHLVEKDGEKCSARIALFLKNLETFGHKDDFRINRSYLTPGGLLCLDLPEEILKKSLAAKACAGVVGGHPEGLDESFAGFMYEGDPGTWPVQEGPPVIEVNCNPVLDSILPADDGVDHGGGMEDDNDPLPDAPLEPEASESDGGEAAVVSKPEEWPPPPDGTKKEEDPDDSKPVNGRFGMRRRGPKEHVAEVKITNPLRPLDPHVETPAKRPVRAGRLRKPIPCNCHKELSSKRNSRSKSNKGASSPDKKEARGVPSVTPVSTSVESFITRDLVELVQQQSHKGGPLDPRLVGELAREEAKRNNRKAALAKATKEEEGKAKAPPAAAEEHEGERGLDLGEDDPVPDLDFDNVSPHPDELDLPDPHGDQGAGLIHTPFGVISAPDGWGGKAASLNDTLLYEPSSEYEALVQKWVSDVLGSAQEHISSSDLARRVNRWRKRIAPRLEEEERRRAFDIHQYGTHILSHFPGGEDVEEGAVSSTVLFADLARDHEASEVSRMFLSCLMLANTYNVELSQTTEGDLEMDCLQLRLLTHVRHHQELEEYAPPSHNQRPQPHPPPRSPLRRSIAASAGHTTKKKKRRTTTTTSSSSSSSSSFSSSSDEEEAPHDSDGRRPNRGGGHSLPQRLQQTEVLGERRQPAEEGEDELVSRKAKRSAAAAVAGLTPSPKTSKKRRKLKEKR